MFGVLITAFILIELFGFRGTLNIGAFLNLSISVICAITALYNFNYPVVFNKLKNYAGPNKEKTNGASGPFLIILFSTGFICMALEVIWTRDFTIVLKTQVYSFAALLFVYLLSTFFGSWLYRTYSNVLVIKLPILLFLALSFSLLPVLIDDPRIQQSFYGVLLSIMPFCIVLGYVTPMLVDQYSFGDPKRAAKAYALNVLGCIFGPLIASYLFLPFLGVKISMILLSGLFLPFFYKEVRAFFFLSPIKKTLFVFILAVGILEV
jgi:hypothetical protein